MKSFLQGKRSLDVAALKAPQTCLGSAGEVIKQADEAAGAGMSPHIDIVKQGDKIMRIIVTCTCGERTEIDCLYPPGQ